MLTTSSFSSQRPSTAIDRPVGLDVRILLIAGLSLLLHLIYLNQPFVDAQNWRQADTAAIARNFYTEDFRLLYPRVDWRGTTEGYVESEFPLYPYLVAILYTIFGGVHEELGRFLAAVFFACSVLMLFKIAAKFYTRNIGYLSALLFTLMPINVFYGRTFMVESLMILCSMAMVYQFSEWLDRGGWVRFLLGVGWSALALLLKIPTLYMGLPLLFLAHHRFGKKMWGQWTLWVFAVLVLLPPILWYAHAYRLFLQTHLTFGIWNAYGYPKFGALSLRLDPAFYATLLERIFGVILTPIGGVLFLVGLLWPVREGRTYVFHVWVLAVGIYIFIAAEGNRALDYYQMPLVPPAVILMAKPLWAVLDGAVLQRTVVGHRLSTPAAVGLFVALIAAFSFTYAQPLFKGYPHTAYFAGQVEIGKQVDQWASRDIRIVVIDLDENRRAPYRSQNPVLLYHCNRKGWQITPDEASPERIEALRAQGATVLVTSILEMVKNTTLWDYLKSNYQLLARNDQFMAVALLRQP